MVISVLVIGAIVAIVLVTNKGDDDSKNSALPSQGEAGNFTDAGVATDHTLCSTIGAEMLKKGGSAADAAIAATFCTGVANPFSCGIGGGGFMVFFEKKTSKFHVYDYRETAPAAANETMYLNKSSTIGKQNRVRFDEPIHIFSSCWWIRDFKILKRYILLNVRHLKIFC